MRKYIPLFTLLLLAGIASCTNSHEDDITYYVPKQVNEAEKEEAPKTVLYTLTYDKQGRIKTEATDMEVATIYYNETDIGRVDSVQFVKTDKAKEAERKEVAGATGVKPEEVAVTDSIKAIYSHTASSIDIALKTYRKGKDAPETADAQITLNAQLLPLTYTNGTSEQRYSYDTEGRLTVAEWYVSGALTKKQEYNYGGVKSPYAEVQHYPAWYLVAYRQISPIELPIKSTIEENGASRVEYELPVDKMLISDLDLPTKCAKTTYDSQGTPKTYILRYEYMAVVFD